MNRQPRLHALDRVVGDCHPQIRPNHHRQQTLDEPEQIATADDQHQVAHRHGETHDREQTQKDAENDPRVLRLDPVQNRLGVVPEGVDHEDQHRYDDHRQQVIEDGIARHEPLQPQEAVAVSHVYVTGLVRLWLLQLQMRMVMLLVVPVML